MQLSPDRGQTFVRTIKSMAVAGGQTEDAIAYAESQNWHNLNAITHSIRSAAVAPYGTDDVTLPTPAETDLAEFVRPLTILGKLQGLRRWPSRVRMLTATNGSTAYWRGEKNVRPISKLALQGSTLEPLSIIAICAVTMELLRSSKPGAEGVLSRDLAAACAYEMDSAFIGHQNAGSAGIRPAGIASGVTALHSAGSSLANIDSDLGLLIQALTDAGSDLQFATFVVLPRTALYLSRLRGTGGNPAYPAMTARGGTLLGLPCITSAAVRTDAGSPSTTHTAITLLDPSQIVVADDGGSALEMSQNTALQMSDAPANGETSLVSLFQNDAAALKITRYANWRRCRDGMAQVLDQVAY